MNRPPQPPDEGGGASSPRDANAPAEESLRPRPQVDESTGLPGLRSWRAVYTVVVVLFVVWVALLTALTVAYA